MAPIANQDGIIRVSVPNGTILQSFRVPLSLEYHLFPDQEHWDRAPSSKCYHCMGSGGPIIAFSSTYYDEPRVIT